MAKFILCSIISSFGRALILVLIYFLFLYSFQVPGVPIGNVSLVLCILIIYIIYVFISGKINHGNTKTGKMVRSYWWWNVFLLIYVSCLLLLWGSGNGTDPLIDYIMMLIMLPIVYISGNHLFRNLDDLMKILYIGVIIQSVIILAALFLPALKIGLTFLFPEGAYNTDRVGGMEKAIANGYNVGLGVFSSAGCLKMAIGQIGACYYLVKNRGSKLFCHLILYLLIAVSTSLVARTGLLISAGGLLFVFMAKRKQGGNFALRFGVLLFFILIIGCYFIIAYFPADFLEDIFQRLIRTADNGIKDSFLGDYTGETGTNVMPPICFETIIGLGITIGTSGSGIVTITDGGFMRNFSAMGLIVALINYIIIVFYFLKQYKTSNSYDNKIIILFISFIFLVGEFKEYYLYYFSPICIAFLIFNFISKDERNSFLIIHKKISHSS